MTLGYCPQLPIVTQAKQINHACAVKVKFYTFGLHAGDDVPDARTICYFKQLLEKDGRDGTRRLFERFGRQLQSKGLLAQEGSIVDASFVAALRQHNSCEQTARPYRVRNPRIVSLIQRIKQGDAKKKFTYAEHSFDSVA